MKKLKLWIKSHEENPVNEAYKAVRDHGFVCVEFVENSAHLAVLLAEGPLENAAAWLSEEPRTAPFPAGALLFYQFA